MISRKKDPNFHKILVFFLAKDCNQRRPGAVWVTKKEKDPAKIDKEYEAFVEDMIGYDPNKSSKSTEKPYVPPMGDLSKSLAPTSKPLMLTHKFSNSIGSSAPGAASAEMRAMSDPQKAGGLRVIIHICFQIYSTTTFFVGCFEIYVFYISIDYLLSNFKIIFAGYW